MGLFGGTKEKGIVQPKMRTMTASGLRINTSNTEVGNDLVRLLSSTRQEWQSDAWGYRDKIGELRFAFQFLARAASRVKYAPAQVMPDEDEPIMLGAEKGVVVAAALRTAAQEELSRLPLDAGFRFIGVLAENLQVAGEAWIHGFTKGGQERWEVLSVDEVSPGVDGRFTITRYGTVAQEPVDLSQEEMLRVWVPHSRFQIVADSPMRANMSVCEEIVLAGREMRAASRSRFSSNGILLVSDGLTLLNALKEDRGQLEDNSFVADLYAAMMAPIANEGDPGQVAPIVVTGNPEDLKATQHIKLDRITDDKLLDRIDRCLARLARGLDIPPEIVSGMADANHWTAWQIDASTFRTAIAPLVQMIADSLTEAFLRPALLARGFTEDDVKLVQVWYDAGAVTENPNRAQDTKDAFDRGAIGYNTLRQELGFNESDAPSDEEVLRMVAQRIGLDAATAGVLLQRMLLPDEDPVESIAKRVVDPAKEIVPSENPDAGNPSAAPGTADAATPDTKPSQLSAGALRVLSVLAAAPSAADDPGDDWIMDTDHGRKLMEVDRSMRDQLLSLADGAVVRALEKAGARVRSKAQKDASLRALAATAGSVLDVASVLGRDAVTGQLALSDDELFADALAALREKFARIVGAGIDRTVKLVLALLRIPSGSDRATVVENALRSQMSSRVDGGWTRFRAGLTKVMNDRLYHPHPDVEPGEVPDAVVPARLVRDALAYVGGQDAAPADDAAPPIGGGVALGGHVMGTLAAEGATVLGFEWAYGITPVRHFEPHRELDGQRFDSWRAAGLRTGERYAWVGEYFQPGDHNGCMCDYVPSFAVREYAEVVREGLAEETPNARADRLLAEHDDRAGRRGTTAQLSRDERNRILALQSRYLKAER